MSVAEISKVVDILPFGLINSCHFAGPVISRLLRFIIISDIPAPGTFYRGLDRVAILT